MKDVRALNEAFDQLTARLEKLEAPRPAAPVLPPVPTVGRIVHFGGTTGAIGAPVSVARPAIVLRVHERNVVDLVVLVDDDQPLLIERDVEHSEDLDSGMWSWPART